MPTWQPLSRLPLHLRLSSEEVTEVVLLHTSGEQARAALRLDPNEKGHGARAVMPPLDPLAIMWATPAVADPD